MDLHSATSLQDSEDGAWLCELLGCPTTTESGQLPPLVNPLVPPGLAEEQTTKGTCGLLSPDSSKLAAPPESSASKLPAASLPENPELRVCSDCGSEKPLSEFARTGWKKTYRTVCKSCRNAEARTMQQMRSGSTATRASRLVAGAKGRAALKGLPFDLTVKWVQEALDSGVCEATGIPFNLESKRGWDTPSLDQIQPAAGYTTGNTRVILFGLNAACGNWGENKVIQMANAIMQKRRARSNELQQKLTERLIAKTEQLGSTLYNLTWKTWVTPSGQSRSRLRASVLRTSETARTGWPTPIANDTTGSTHCYGPEKADGSERNRYWKLPGAAALAGWPTPMAGTPAQNGNNAAGNNDSSRKTVELVSWHLAGWPTPSCNNDRTGKPESAISMQREDGSKVQQRLQDFAAICGPARLTDTGQLLTGSDAGMESGGQLNPAHSLWLMACPSALAASAPGSDDWLRWQGLMQQVLSERKLTAPGCCPAPEMLSILKRPESLSNVLSDLSDLL